MQLPPDANNSTPENSADGKSLSDLHPYFYAAQVPHTEDNTITSDDQASNFILHKAPPPPLNNKFTRTRIFWNKRTYILVGLTLLIIISIVVPVFFSQRFFSPRKATSTPEVVAVTPTHTLLPPPGRAILPTPGKIMTGVHIADDLKVVSSFEKDAGKKASIVVFYQAWGETEGDQNFPTLWTTSARNHGSLPLITWEPWASGSYDQPTYSLKNIIAGKFDDYIKQWAQDAKAWRYPFFLIFAPEMNGNWFPWSESVNGNKAGEFVQAWRHVHAIFTAIGVTNVTWVWSPNVEYPGSTSLSELYPGDAYVDWTAIDGFNWGSTNHNKWLTFSQVFSPTYKDILKITLTSMMIAETGCVEQGGNKASWITDTYFIELPKRFTSVKAIVWSDQTTPEDWRIETSKAAMKAFSKAMHSSLYASNIYGGTYIGG